jgi:hypothetical protein
MNAQPSAIARAVLGIDPGPEQSGVVALVNGKVAMSDVLPNAGVLALLRSCTADLIAIEMIASYGMPVGAEVFETCVWIGKFELTAEQVYQPISAQPPRRVVRIPRKDVKLHLCGSSRAKDGNIRQRLIDLLGAPGTKKQPGGTYGVKSHAWAALAVAVTASETSR